jgi:hypothetical protein
MSNAFYFTHALISALPDYAQYRAHINELFAQGKTTGLTQTPEYLNFTKLNIQRMDRWDKTFVPSNEMITALHQLAAPQYWIVISEAWCGDCAQNLPILAAIAAASAGKIDLRITGRDDNPDLMNAYLTNGARSVPKLIILHKQTLAEITTWGPRPAPAQQLLHQYKQSNGAITHDDFEIQLHT